MVDLAGDDVSPGGLIFAEDLAEQPFGQHVLTEHLVHCVQADVRVQRRLAHAEEGVECRDCGVRGLDAVGVVHVR